MSSFFICFHRENNTERGKGRKEQLESIDNWVQLDCESAHLQSTIHLYTRILTLVLIKAQFQQLISTALCPWVSLFLTSCLCPFYARSVKRHLKGSRVQTLQILYILIASWFTCLSKTFIIISFSSTFSIYI